jgi:hypothetical protein
MLEMTASYIDGLMTLSLRRVVRRAALPGGMRSTLRNQPHSLHGRNNERNSPRAVGDAL